MTISGLKINYNNINDANEQGNCSALIPHCTNSVALAFTASRQSARAFVLFAIIAGEDREGGRECGGSLAVWRERAIRINGMVMKCGGNYRVLKSHESTPCNPLPLPESLWISALFIRQFHLLVRSQAAATNREFEQRPFYRAS